MTVDGHRLAVRTNVMEGLMPATQGVRGWWGWTEDVIQTLIKLRREGYSATEIGYRMGITRCAVLGKIHRLGVSVPRMASTTSEKKKAKPPNKLGGFKFGAGGPAPECSAPPVNLPQYEMPPARARGAAAALLALEPRDCRWPIGDPRSKEFRFCGSKCGFGRMYCEHHHITSRGVFRRYDKS